MPLATLSDALADAVDGVLPSIVGLRGRRFHGTGLALGGELFVTASRGLGQEALQARLPDGSVTHAEVVGRDRSTGLAVVRVPGVDLPAPTWAEDVPRLGEIAIIVGRGERAGATWGLVSAVGPAWTTSHGGAIDAFIDVDASLPWGFPGGPLVDTQGRVVALNLRDLVRGGTSVPASTVRRVARRLAERGSVKPGFLGIGAVPAALNARQAEVAGQGEGMLLVSVEPDGPAAAELAVGDVIVAVDGMAVASLPGLQGRLAHLGAGHAAVFRVLRGDALVEVTITLGARPA
jgi:S1-C subfamily serine protease